MSVTIEYDGKTILMAKGSFMFLDNSDHAIVSDIYGEKVYVNLSMESVFSIKDETLIMPYDKEKLYKMLDGNFLVVK